MDFWSFVDLIWENGDICRFSLEDVSFMFSEYSEIAFRPLSDYLLDELFPGLLYCIYSIVPIAFKVSCAILVVKVGWRLFCTLSKG